MISFDDSVSSAGVSIDVSMALPPMSNPWLELELSRLSRRRGHSGAAELASERPPNTRVDVWWGPNMWLIMSINIWRSSTSQTVQCVLDADVRQGAR